MSTRHFAGPAALMFPRLEQEAGFTMETNDPDHSSTVRFIDNRLPQMDPFFQNAPVHYDAKSQQYVGNSQPLQSSSFFSMPRPPPRPEWTTLRALEVWNSLYSDAMKTFVSDAELQKRRDKHNFLAATDWDDVYAILERARDKYQNRTGHAGWFTRVRRKAADNVAPVQSLAAVSAKLVPDNPYSTPVLGAVGIVLDVSVLVSLSLNNDPEKLTRTEKALKQTASVRKEVAEMFDGEGFQNLIPIFSDVELFLGEMFNNDRNIYGASLDLAVAALKAIHCTVGFYTSNPLLRAGQAMSLGTDYAKDLIDSLKDLNAKSKRLGEQAYKSHMRESQLYSEYGRKEMGNLREIMVRGYNGIYYFLQEHEKRQDAKRERDMARLRADIEMVRFRSPSPVFSIWPPPVSPPPAWVPIPVLPPPMTQVQLEMMVGMSTTDQEDMEFIRDKKSEFPDHQRAQAEQIIQQHLFRDWIVPADSSSLLVQWGTSSPRTYADLTPLSVFCTEMVRALGASDRFLSIQWFCGRHLRHDADGGMGPAMARSLIAQLLRGRPGGFDMHALTQTFALPSRLASRDDVAGLTGLLVGLVRALPAGATLFCLVDGVVLCERREHQDALPVLAALLALAADPTLPATVKVLFASAPGPVVVREPFEEDGLILNVETLPRLETVPSDERFVRQLGPDFGD